MSLVALKRQRPPQLDLLSELTDGYSQILALFDGSTAMRRIVDEVPALSGAFCRVCQLRWRSQHKA
jgi:hypothetical protein